LLPLGPQQYVQCFMFVWTITDIMIQVLCSDLWIAWRQEGKDELWQPEGQGREIRRR
jgi:hypothetical protein